MIKNDNFIKNLKIKLKYQGFEKEYKEFEGNKRIQFPLKLDKNFEGEYRDIIEIKYTLAGKEESFKTSIVINVLKDQKTILNKKLKQSRSLL